MSIGAKFPKTDSGISVMSFWYIMDYFHVGIQKQFRSYAYAIRVREEVVGSIPIKIVCNTAAFSGADCEAMSHFSHLLFIIGLFFH